MKGKHADFTIEVLQGQGTMSTGIETKICVTWVHLLHSVLSHLLHFLMKYPEMLET